MKKVIFLFVLALFLHGCLTTKTIKRHCSDFAALCLTDGVVKTDTIRVPVQVIIQDTVYVKLPKDTVKVVDTLVVVNNVANLPMKTYSFGIIWVAVGVTNNVLDVQASLKDSSLLVPIIDTVYVYRDIINTQHNQVVKQDEKGNTANYILIAVFVLAVLIFIYLIKKGRS